MSTDIIQFDKNEKEYQWGALNWYIMVTLPFMAASFATWYGFIGGLRGKKSVRRQQKVRILRSKIVLTIQPLPARNFRR